MCNNEYGHEIHHVVQEVWFNDRHPCSSTLFQVFEKLKDTKSPKGYTLSNAIMTGVVTPHLGVGATAGDEDCWETFKDLYYPIIKEWHGYDPETQVRPHFVIFD